MSNPEFPNSRVENASNDYERSLARYPGLRETLVGWCETNGEDGGPLTFKQIVQAMKNDPDARQAVREFLTRDPAIEVDPEVAGDRLDQLAWALVDAISENQ